MKIQGQAGDQWIVFRLMEQSFAVPSVAVHEMMAMPPVRSIPRSPSRIRGVIDRRGTVLPVIDLRLWLGMPSYPEGVDNFCTMLGKREQDHRNWLQELDASVEEGREFKLTTDPHACAFGRWYDTYQAEDPWLIAALRKFDAPHKRIHEIGTAVSRLVKQDQREEARRMINEARDGDLAKMITLFAEFKEKLREASMETAMILAAGDALCTVAVDLVAAVETLEEGSLEDLPPTAASGDGLIVGIGKRLRGKGLVLILDVEHLLREVGARELSAA